MSILTVYGANTLTQEDFRNDEIRAKQAREVRAAIEEYQVKFGMGTIRIVEAVEQACYFTVEGYDSHLVFLQNHLSERFIESKLKTDDSGRPPMFRASNEQ